MKHPFALTLKPLVRKQRQEDGGRRRRRFGVRHTPMMSLSAVEISGRTPYSTINRAEKPIDGTAFVDWAAQEAPSDLADRIT
jgi:hypothetical protein